MFLGFLLLFFEDGTENLWKLWLEA